MTDDFHLTTYIDISAFVLVVLESGSLRHVD